MGLVFSAEEIGERSQYLWAVEAWLRVHCSARNAGQMADICKRAAEVLEDVYDEQAAAEGIRL